MEYEYEPELEQSYRASLVRSFKKQVEQGLFHFFIVDCVNEKLKHYQEMVEFAKKMGFEVSAI